LLTEGEKDLALGERKVVRRREEAPATVGFDAHSRAERGNEKTSNAKKNFAHPIPDERRQVFPSVHDLLE
jgi:hypothetical protein